MTKPTNVLETESIASPMESPVAESEQAPERNMPLPSESRGIPRGPVSPPEPPVELPVVVTGAVAVSPPVPPPVEPPAEAAEPDDSSTDIAAFLNLQFAGEPLAPAPRRASSSRGRDPLDADVSRTLGVYQLAAALVVAALFSVAPAVWDLVEYVRIDELDAPFVARWALILFFLGIVQLAYAVYLFQLPDWSTVWVVTMFLLMMAAGYAAMLGMVLISDADGFFVGEHGLQLSDKLAGGKAALWCLCMVSAATILAFFAGRMSVRWRQAERMLQSVQY